MSRATPRADHGLADQATSRMRHEIALRAARFIAEDGLDYAGAKRRAAREVLGSQRIAGEVMPDNALVEAEVRAYQELFQSDTQPARLSELQHAAARLMEMLQEFAPHLVGAIANGTAGEHSDIHLQLYCDSAKDVEIFLLNQGIEFDVDEARPGAQRHAQSAEEVIRFVWRARGQAPEGVHLSVYSTNGLRSAFAGERRHERIDLSALRQMIGAKENR